jgi:hypothetical protein
MTKDQSHGTADKRGSGCEPGAGVRWDRGRRCALPQNAPTGRGDRLVEDHSRCSFGTET